MKTWMKLLALGGCLAIGTTGCDDLGPDSDGIDMAVVRAEAAMVAADGMFQDLSLAQDPGLQELGFGGMGAGPMLVSGPGGSCQRVGSGPTFDCGQMARDGFTFTREVTFFDEYGEEQLDGFDKETTDAIHLVFYGEGSRERSFWSATMVRSRDMWITELLSGAHVLNGTGSSTISRSHDPELGVAHTFDMSVEVVWEDVVHLQPREENPYPESGTITRDFFVEVTRDGEVVGGRAVTTVVTFNGTQHVIMTVDGVEVEIDLAERGVNRRFGRMGGKG